MCTPSAKKDNSAKKAKRAEEARQARIEQGQNNIDLAFEGFDNDYFRNYRGDFEGYYLPQLDKQYGNAKKQLTFNLARNGNLEASAGADAYGDAEERYLDARTDVANKALDSVNAFRGRLEDQKSNLYALNASSADPAMAVARSASAASLLSQPPGYGPLSDVFASLLNSGAQTVAAERQGYRGTGTGLFAPPSNNHYGSGYIVPAS